MLQGAILLIDHILKGARAISERGDIPLELIQDRPTQESRPGQDAECEGKDHGYQRDEVVTEIDH